ncbi:MAG: PhoPQ-activated pathogenicity-related family protein [Sedimentisphaerales bacterium]|nr:PhoPQ-activated pathogenicity-related family protein [Sedimentisphaerales bacterium]
MKRQTVVQTYILLISTALIGTHVFAGILSDYVYRPDPAYRYELIRTVQSDQGAGYILNMTSQTWRNKDEVNRTEWQHWVHIAVPRTVKHTTALLIIDSNYNGSREPEGIDGGLAATAVRTQSVAVKVQMIPNEPLRFPGEDHDRWEDDIIAYSWDKYLTTGDSDWPLQLPMVKSAVRGMDTVQNFIARLTGNLHIDSFVVAGASKRGWTTWLTAAVDKRVVAIAPVVIDMLNTQESFDHHFAVYGFYAPAVAPYEKMKIFDRIDTPMSDKLMQIVDPYVYRDRLTMPKFMINSAGDQFFLPDSWRFYFDGLKGVKYLRYVPNCGHGLKDTDALESLNIFYQSILEGWKLPQFTFSHPGPDTIRVTCKDAPSSVLLWQATNPDARDFRDDVFGKKYTSTPLTANTDGSYTATVDKPDKGFTAFFVELTFPSPGPFPYKFTTGTRIIPDTEPFAKKLKEKKKQ